MFRLSPVAWHYIWLQTDITNCFMSYRTVGNLSAVTLVSVVKYNCLGLFQWLWGWVVILSYLFIIPNGGFAESDSVFWDYFFFFSLSFFFEEVTGRELASDFYLFVMFHSRHATQLKQTPLGHILDLTLLVGFWDPKANCVFVIRMNLTWACRFNLGVLKGCVSWGNEEMVIFHERDTIWSWSGWFEWVPAVNLEQLSFHYSQI